MSFSSLQFQLKVAMFGFIAVTRMHLYFGEKCHLDLFCIWLNKRVSVNLTVITFLSWKHPSIVSAQGVLTCAQCITGRSVPYFRRFSAQCSDSHSFNMWEGNSSANVRSLSQCLVSFSLFIAIFIVT